MAPAPPKNTPKPTMRLVADAQHLDVLDAIQGAQTSLWISTANLKELKVPRPGRKRWGSVLHVLDELSCNGVDIRMLHASGPSKAFRKSFDGFERLVAGGMEIRMCPRVHLKLVIVDGTWAYIGSANWTGAGLGAKGEHRRNFEMGIVTTDNAALDTAQARYDRIWRGAECAKCRLRDRCPAPLDA